VSKVKVLDRLVGIIEFTLKLPASKVDIDADFASLGINSLIVMELIENIDREFQVTLNPALFGDVSTLSELAGLLEGMVGDAVQVPLDAARDLMGYISQKYAVDFSQRQFGSVDEIVDALVADHSDDLLRYYGLSHSESACAPAQAHDIAIVGMSCRLPDASDIRTFWANLLAEKNSVREIPESRWNWEQHFSAFPAPGKTVSKWGALLKDVDCFDAGFFNIPAQEAMAMDPQQRLLLQEAYRAVEDGGIDMQTLAGSKTGVFIGYQYSEYEQQMRRLDNQDMQAGPVFSSSSPSYYLANRLSFAFDFRGPSESFNVNCASSAVAINRAYYSLVNGESDTALVGGVSLNLFVGDYIASSQYGLLSPNGTSGVFDNHADGFVRGEGVAAIVLKRLEDAERDNNRIYAVIKSCHQNYRGAARSLSEVKHESITDVLRSCYEKAGIDPETVRYIEVDGYATKWADSFEYEGVKNALRTDRQNGKRCALGSVKGNIGNVEAASGVTNVIKLALSLHHKTFPATISKRDINTFIDIDNASHPLYIAEQAIPFEDIRKGETPIRAGVNSFADSGTNVHILLEEYSAGHPVVQPKADGNQLFVLSAKDVQRLDAYVQAYIDYLSSDAAPESFAGLIHTVQTGRQALDVRLAIVVASRQELIEKLALAKSQSSLDERTGLEFRGIFWGNARIADKNLLAGLITADMARMQLAQSVQSRDWKHIALLWVNGVHIPWEAVWQGWVVPPVALPGYPFARERYWIEVEEREGDRIFAAVASRIPTAAAPDLRAEEGAVSPIWHIYLPISDSPLLADALALNGTEKIQLFIKQEVAKQLQKPVDDIAMDRDFITLGMNSIGIAELIHGIDRLLNSHLSPSVVFQHPEINSLSEYLTRTYPERIGALVVTKTNPATATVASAVVEPEEKSAPPADILVPVQGKGGREPIFALPGAGGNALSLQQLSHALGSDQPFYCLEPVGLDGCTALMTSVEEMAEFNIQRMRSVKTKGPYRLLGYSNGGVVAFEMARQLLERNEKVASLILLDTLCPTARVGRAINEMVIPVFNHFVSSLGAHSDLDVATLQRVPENERSEYLYDFLVRLGRKVPRQQFLTTFNVAIASEQVCRAYRPSRLAQKVDLILFKASEEFRGSPKDYGWGEFLPGPIRILKVKADHFSILNKGPASEIARKIGVSAGKSGKAMARAELAVNA